MIIPTRGNPLTPDNIEEYLNQTKDEHNGYDYNKIAGLVEVGVSKAAIARRCGVHFLTGQKWVPLVKEALRKEQQPQTPPQTQA